jgi:methylenetetrahydrofolate reductase (NADPH)
MSFRKRVSEGKFVVTAEAGPPAIPPKGVDVSQMLDSLAPVRDRVDALNITDLKSSVMRMSALAAAHILREKGFNPILHFTCRDRNRLALQADLLGAWALGIENILIVTGDDVTFGDHPETKPVFDLDSLQLLGAVSRLNEGYDLAGNELEGSPDFFVGAGITVMTGLDGDARSEMSAIEAKVVAGAKFLLTSPIFDIGIFETFVKRVEHFRIPIISGVMLLKSTSMARFLNGNVDNVFVPEALIGQMEKTENRIKTSISIAAELIRELKHLCQGIYLMPIGWEKSIPAVLDAAKL